MLRRAICGLAMVFLGGCMAAKNPSNQVIPEINANGCSTYADLGQYCGQRLNGSPHGKGIVTRKDGVVIRGDWRGDIAWNAELVRGDEHIWGRIDGAAATPIGTYHWEDQRSGVRRDIESSIDYSGRAPVRITKVVEYAANGRPLRFETRTESKGEETTEIVEEAPSGALRLSTKVNGDLDSTYEQSSSGAVAVRNYHDGMDVTEETVQRAMAAKWQSSLATQKNLAAGALKREQHAKEQAHASYSSTLAVVNEGYADETYFEPCACTIKARAEGASDDTIARRCARHVATTCNTGLQLLSCKSDTPWDECQAFVKRATEERKAKMRDCRRRNLELQERSIQLFRPKLAMCARLPTDSAQQRAAWKQIESEYNREWTAKMAPLIARHKAEIKAAEQRERAAAQIAARAAQKLAEQRAQERHAIAAATEQERKRLRQEVIDRRRKKAEEALQRARDRRAERCMKEPEACGCKKLPPREPGQTPRVCPM